MIGKYKQKADLAIKKMIEKDPNGYNNDILLSRIIWNLFTNNNNERPRAKRIIDAILDDTYKGFLHVKK